MSIVYIVTTGIYSDYQIRAVFSDETNAQTLAGKLAEANDVEEWEVDSTIIEPGMDLWQVTMTGAGEVLGAETETYAVASWWRVWERDGNLHGQCWANNREHAVKIANEKRLMMIASGEMEGP